MRYINSILFTLIFFLFISPAYPQLVAFPGAEGFGKYAVGGRTGSVYHVTNLNDSGSGSLRDAVSQPNRIVIFDVAGVININSRMVFTDNLYVAGQTAPGEGIIVYGDGVSFSGASNTIVRYLRFRMGKVGTSGADAAGVANGTNMIFDHLSVSWGLDETFSISPDNKGELGNITIQNCIIGQGLLSHSAGGLIQADYITLYRNLYIDNSTRNAKIKGKNQYVNNIVYNWKNAAYIMGGDSEGNAYCNAVGNLFVKGPSGGGSPFSGGNSLFHLFAGDNWYDNNVDGSLNPYLIPQSEYSGGPDFQAVPYNYPILPTLSATVLMDSLLTGIGSSLPYRDLADYYMVNEVLSFGKSGKLLSEETQLPFGAPSSWKVWAGISGTDTDSDGMPDDWENANGTSPSVNDAMTISANGYANIENYINSLSEEQVQPYLRAPVCFELKTSTPSSLSLTWLDYTENEDGFIVEMQVDGSFTEIGRTSSKVNSIKIDSLEPGAAYKFRTRAYRGETYSDFTDEFTFKTQPLEVEVIDPIAFQPDYIWSAGNSGWDFTSSNWNNNASIFNSNSNVLFEPLSPITVTLNDTVEVKAVVIRDDGDVTINGIGSISGVGSLNKTGSGKLTLNTNNKYTGATVLWDGTFEFPILSNGGVASSFGASQEFAQNWIWKGGTWKYTGTSTATNRSAKLYGETVFNIANSGTTVTMDGTLEGTGSLILDGAGTMRINKPFAYTGNTTLKGGTLYIEGATMLDQGIGTSPKLVLAGGSFKTKDINDRYGNYNFPIEVVQGTYSIFSVHRNCSINSKVSGSGTLEYQVNYLREYIKGNWNDFTGNLIANGVNSTSGDCQLMLLNGVGIPNAVVQTKGNLQIVCWSTEATYYLGGLSGTAGTYLSGSSKNTSGAKMTWIVGGANTDETFRGVIDNRCSASGYNGTTSIVKNGDGIWRLTGANVYKGTTTVAEGILIVNGTHTGTGAVTVNGGATLAGSGSLNGKVTILDGALIRAGDTLVNNFTFILEAGLTLSGQSVTEIPLSKTTPITRKTNKISVFGIAALNGTLKLNLDNIIYDLSSGNYFDVFDFSNATVTGTFSSITPAVPGDGFIWDTSKLYTEGRIYVREEGYTAISSVSISDTRIYPTMVTDKLNVELPSSVTHVNACIYDNAGKLSEIISMNKSESLDVSSLSDGIYFLKLTDQCGNMTTKKFVKQ